MSGIPTVRRRRRSRNPGSTIKYPHMVSIVRVVGEAFCLSLPFQRDFVFSHWLTPFTREETCGQFDQAPFHKNHQDRQEPEK